jgi:poly(A) polymerase
VTDPVIDAQRRDFTANALYLELGSGRLLDPTGGLADLQRGVLRAIGAPDQRFREDALRLLRAVRCAARYGLDLDPAVAAAVRARAGLATTLSAERVLAELTAMFTAPGRGRALRMLHRLGLSQQLLPEVAALEGVSQPPQYHPEGDVLVHTCLVLEHAPTGDPVLAWSAVLHDIGKPATWRQGEDRIRFDGHDALSADMADAVLGRLRAPSLLRERVVDVVREHIRFAALPDMRPRKRELWMRTPGFRQHVAFHRADCLGSHGDLSRYAAVLGLWRALPPLRPAALCTGRDVLALGVPAGPMVGRLLRELHATAEDRGIEDRDRALALLAEMAGPHVKARGSGGR